MPPDARAVRRRHEETELSTVNADAPAAVPQLALRDEWTPLRVLLGDIYARRDLCTTLARKDFFVRYRRATFGLLWAVALPARGD